MESIVSIGANRGAKGLKAVSIREEICQLWSRVTAQSESPRVVAICATFAGEGTSTVAANLALFLAEQGRSISLIEANLRRPSLATHFGVATTPGLAEFMDGKASREEVVRHDILPGMSLAPAGGPPQDLYGLFSRGAFARFIAEAEPAPSVTVLDLPPLSQAPETLVILKSVDLVLLVVRAHRTRRHAVQRAVATLEELGVTVGGAILNRITHRVPTFLDRLL